MITEDQIRQLAGEYVNEVYDGDTDFMEEAESVFSWLTRTHCIVCREFVNRERLVIEFDKKQMPEKSTGERMALAGVYQAKLELMDKLFGKSSFEEKVEK